MWYLCIGSSPRQTCEGCDDCTRRVAMSIEDIAIDDTDTAPPRCYGTY